MGVDPAALDLRQYHAMLDEWNVRHSPDGKSKSTGSRDLTDLRLFMEAHSVH